ncbi:MAG: DmsE family decaheme c-type cytochrome [Gemmatimonadetes bacterium]|nr:DmsE family decaheme c-type cytochrome [Gemmatimonadota bacterium]
MSRRHRQFTSVAGLCLAIPLLVVARAGPLWSQSPGSSSAEQPQSAQYVGPEVCQGCHADQAASWEATPMGRVFLHAARNDLEARGCEACHGPGSEHVQGAGDTTKIFRFGKSSRATIEEQNAQCLQCHDKGIRLYWKGSMHESRKLSCVTCHSVMKQVSPERLLVKETVAEVCYQCHLMRKAQSQLSSHMPIREGKTGCNSCHNPHGSAAPKLLVENSVNEVCYRCHAERRGPFLWEHPPVTENCLNCHEPHGSINDNLLKVRAPRLCQRCHIESRHPTTPQAAAGRFAFNRSCTNCHSQIHGSNHPSGVRFHR